MRPFAKRDVAAAEQAMREHFTVGPIAVEAETTTGQSFASASGRKPGVSAEARGRDGGPSVRHGRGRMELPMLRFDTIIGDIPYLLLGIPLTLALTAVAFVAGLLLALPIVDRAQRRGAGDSARWMRLVVDFFAPPRRSCTSCGRTTRCRSSRISGLMPFSVVAGALACSSAAQMSEIFRGAIVAVPRGQWDAASVIGLNYLQRRVGPLL